MHQMDLDQILKDCLKHKPEAQRKLYEIFAPSMLGICFRYTKSMADAEEVLQEEFELFLLIFTLAPFKVVVSFFPSLVVSEDSSCFLFMSASFLARLKFCTICLFTGWEVFF